MIELIVGTYGVMCWLVFKKLKLVPVTTYTVCTAILGGVGILLMLYITLSVFHPVSHDGRMYAPVVQIVPPVRGVVVEVPVEANKPLKKGDVLFVIDPVPFRIEVDRLRALLASKNVAAAQIADDLYFAEAKTKQARADLTVAESKYDRQLREAHDSAKAAVQQVKDRIVLAEAQFKRAEEGKNKGAVSQQEYDRTLFQLQSQQAELVQAEAAERTAAEQLKSGSASLESARQSVAQAEAAERKIRTEFNAMIGGKSPEVRASMAIRRVWFIVSDQPIGGQTPEVREIMAQLEKARWDLEMTTVRAPTDGYVPQLLLRPGMMAVPIPLKPLMMFVVNERPTLVASFPQKTIADIKPGLEGEAVFKEYPGRSYKVKVRRVLTAVREGELDAGGQIITGTAATEPGHIPVVFDYEEDVLNLNLPVGAQASIAIYTEKLHPLAIVRKIILRIKSWENYVF